MAPTDKPSIGRIVHLRTPNGVAPAIITSVHEEDGPGIPGLGLYVFEEFGAYGLVGVQQGEEFGQWFWPPKV